VNGLAGFRVTSFWPRPLARSLMLSPSPLPGAKE
jgi:hypothetical protein